MLEIFRILVESGAEETATLRFGSALLLYLFSSSECGGVEIIVLCVGHVCSSFLLLNLRSGWHRTFHFHSFGLQNFATGFQATLVIFHWIGLLCSFLVLLHHIISHFVSMQVSLMCHFLLIIIASVSHVTIPLLGVCHGVPRVTMSTHIAGSIHCMLSHDLEIRFLLKLLTVVADLLLLGDDSNALAAIKSLVTDLHLEWQLLNLRKVEVLHLHEVGDLLHCVLKGDLGVVGYISDFSSHQS